MEREVKVKKTWHGNISIRDYIVREVVNQIQDIIVVLQGTGLQMLIPHKELGEGEVSNDEYISKHDGKSYRLVDYPWKPTITQEKLL